MRLDPAGQHFIAGAVVLAVVSGFASGWTVAVPFGALAAFFAFFFRDPERVSPADPDAVLAPADGRVLVAGPATAGAPPGRWLQISIFLSPFDVHVNRVPVSGRITKVSYVPGRFLPAYRDNAAAVNERSEVWIDHDGCTVIARQVVGILARRVVCRVSPGTDVRAGERFGIMKFGSRMDVFLPEGARLVVKVGDAVRGGETVIAVLR
jgi:phosphatidylserine decarboxylase